MAVLNPHISIDCVILGFNSQEIKVLLIEREQIEGFQHAGLELKLPGSLNESFDSRNFRKKINLLNFLSRFRKKKRMLVMNRYSNANSTRISMPNTKEEETDLNYK